MAFHKVKTGDSWESIAKQYGLNSSDLMGFNGATAVPPEGTRVALPATIGAKSGGQVGFFQGLSNVLRGGTWSGQQDYSGMINAGVGPNSAYGHNYYGIGLGNAGVQGSFGETELGRMMKQQQTQGYNSNVRQSPVRPGENQPPPQIGASSGGINPSLDSNAQPFIDQATQFAPAGTTPPSNPFNQYDGTFGNTNPVNYSGFGEGSRGGYGAQPTSPSSSANFTRNPVTAASNQYGNDINAFQSFSDNFNLTGKADETLLPQQVSSKAMLDMAKAAGLPAYQLAAQYGYEYQNGQFIKTGKSQASGGQQQQGRINVGGGRFFQSQQAYETWLRGFKYKQRFGQPASNAGSSPVNTLALRIGGG